MQGHVAVCVADVDGGGERFDQLAVVLAAGEFKQQADRERLCERITRREQLAAERRICTLIAGPCRTWIC